jgi:dihydroorotase
MKLLLKSATLVDPNQPKINGKKMDVLIEEGTISKIAAEIDPQESVRQIILDNLHVSPGWFDTGVSFGEPGHEERETISNGLKVAANSGFTGIVLNTSSRPVPDSSSDIVFLKDRAQSEVSELFPMGTLSLGAKGIDLAELYDMHLAGAVAFSDFKNPLENPNLLKLALLYSQHFNGLVHSFPLDFQLGHKGQVNEGEVAVRLGLKGIPSLAEAVRVGRDLAILAYTGGNLHIPTISTREAVSQIADAKAKGLNVTCSVAIHNLFFDETTLESFDSVFKVMPPLRTQMDRLALIQGLKDGVIDFVSSDHSPMDIEEKRLEFDQAAFGSLGLESIFGAMRCIFSTETCVEILTRGRRRYGLSEMGIQEGNIANLTLFNPDSEYVQTEADLRSSSKNSMYLNNTLLGKAYGVIVGNKTTL